MTGSPLNKRLSFPWFGVLLIFGGSVLLLDRLNVLQFGFWRILWMSLAAFGAVRTVEGFSMNRRGRVFWGTLIFLYGVYFFLRSLEIAYLRHHMFLPVTLLIVGMSIMMLYLHNVRDVVLLVPAVPLLAVGAAMVLGRIEVYDLHDLWSVFRTYWPVILVGVGLWMILRGKSRIKHLPGQT